MVVACNYRDLWGWYVLTWELGKTIESRIPEKSTTTEHVETIEHHHSLLLHRQQQDLSEAQKVVVENKVKNNQDKGKPSSSNSEYMISIQQKLEEAHQDDVACSWARFCIYKVPHYVKDGEDKAYIPQVVSLGPYHHGKKRLRQMDHHKWRAFQHILKRTNQDINMYLHSVKKLEERARACYERTIAMSSNEFVEMMVLDGCFILELFRGVAEGFEQLGYPLNDPVFSFSKHGSMHAIRRDMIMLENQIPIFILDKLLGLQLGYPDKKGLVAKLALKFFDPLVPTDEPLTIDSNSILEPLGCLVTFDPLADQRDLHCLDAFRHRLLQSGPQPKSRTWNRRLSHSKQIADRKRQQIIHCVTKLREAGVKFRKKKTDKFWDIGFKNGALWIPKLLIHDGTRSLFLNLIAFEQSHFDCSNHITTYVVFMDNLINSPDDVAYLQYRGIVEHWLGSDAEVSDLFNHLCKEVEFDMNDSYLSKLSAEVNSHYKNYWWNWNAWISSLKHHYFNNPWAIISVIAAVVLLLLTFTQTLYAVYGYYRPSS